MGDIFLKLLNMSITAGWLILAVLCIRVLFKNMPKWIHCLLWGVVAVRLMVPFSIESAFSLLPSAEPIQSSSMAEGEIVPYVPSIDSNLPMVENTVNPLLAKTFSYEESDSAAPLQVVTGIAGSVWLSGMIALLLFAIGSVIRLHLLVRTAVPYKKQIFICDEVSSPFILGLFRPRVYLSSAMEKDEMNYVIAHEKAHLRRKDHLWKPLGYLILCVYWFHPLCWVAYIMLCKDIELACDEKVIKNMSFANKKEYSRVLLYCASQRRLVFSCPLSFGEVGVKERVKSVLKYKKPAFFITLVAVMLCVVVAVCFLTNPAKTYQIKVTVPAGSTAAFCYSEEEISPKGNTLTLANGEGLGDTEVILLPVEVREENAYDESAYMTPGMPVKMDVEKGAWFKIGVNVQNPTAEDKDFYVSVKNVEVRISSEEISESENSMYGEIVAGLGDEEAYAFLSMDYGYDVLLTTDLIYDAGTEQQAAVSCDVYYPVDDEVKKLGSILSDGTAYPLTFTKDGIFAASGHKIEKYGISEEGTLYLEKGVYEQFDEAGNATYIRMTGDQESPSTEAEYQELLNAYGSSQIVHFSYGADGAVNEYLAVEQPEGNAYLQDLAYYLELTVPDLAFRDMSEPDKAELLAEYGTLLDGYTLMARESTDGKTAYIAGHYQGDVADSPLYQMQDMGHYSDKDYQILYSEENREAMERVLNEQGVQAITDEAYVIEKSWMYRTVGAEYIFIQPTAEGQEMYSAFAKYFEPDRGRRYLEDALARGIAVNAAEEPYLNVYLISEEYGEITETIPLTEETAAGILAEDTQKLTDGHGFGASLHTNGESFYFSESKVPQAVLDLAVEKCGYRFESPQSITASITEARFDCSWLDDPLYLEEKHLTRLEEILKSAKFDGVGNCGYGAKLTLTLENGETVTVFKGTDDCGSLVFGSWGGYSLRDEADDEFWELFGLSAEGHERFSSQNENSEGSVENQKVTTENPEEDRKKPEAAIVDASDISRIEVINGNIGERKTLTAEDAYYEYPDMGNPQAERAVNTLEHVTMTMMKYKSWEGEIEITNQTDRELQTGAWYEIQKLEDGVWQLVETRVEIVLEDLAYRLPAGETTVFPTNWKGLYGELPSGEYRVIKYVSVPLADRIETHYLAAEFEIP